MPTKPHRKPFACHAIGPVVLTLFVGAGTTSIPALSGLARDAYSHLQVEVDYPGALPSSHQMYFDGQVANAMSSTVLSALLERLRRIDGIFVAGNEGSGYSCRIQKCGDETYVLSNAFLEAAIDSAVELQGDHPGLPVYVNGICYLAAGAL